MIDHNEKAAKQQALANWENLVGLGTPDAVQQIAKEGIEDGAPQEATIIALDCLSRIGTPAAVKGISQYFLNTRIMNVRVVGSAVSHQLAALLKIETEESEEAILQLAESYRKRAFDDSTFMGNYYHPTEMSQDLNDAYNMVQTPYARQIIAKLGETLPHFTGCARAILVESGDQNFADIVTTFDEQLKRNAPENAKYVVGESKEDWIGRIMRDVAPYDPIATMRGLCEVDTQKAYNLVERDHNLGGHQRVIEETIRGNVQKLLDGYPEHRREFFKIVVSQNANHQYREHRYLEDALHEHLKTLSKVSGYQSVECELIDVYSEFMQYGHIWDIITDANTNKKSIEYGVRKIAAAPQTSYWALEDFVGKQPSKSSFVLGVLVEQGRTGREHFEWARTIANKGDKKGAMQFRDYCLENPSTNAIRQLRHIWGGQHSVQDLLSLEDPVAYEEFGKLATQFAMQGASGMLDKRAQALASGVNDVGLHDTAIQSLVTKLAKPRNVMEAIDKGQARELANVFTSAAEAGLADARSVLEAALSLRRTQRRLGQSEEVFESSVQAFSPKAV